MAVLFHNSDAQGFLLNDMQAKSKSTLGEASALRYSSSVRETWWAQADRDKSASFAATVPSVLETDFALWQLRVDRARGHQTTPFVPHVTLRAVHATRYAHCAGVFAPKEPAEEFTFLVVAETMREASDKVEAQLVAHGYAKNEFAFRYGPSQVILG